MKQLTKKQRKRYEEIVEEKIKLMHHHFSRLMIQMIGEINKEIFEEEGKIAQNKILTQKK